MTKGYRIMKTKKITFSKNSSLILALGLGTDDIQRIMTDLAKTLLEATLDGKTKSEGLELFLNQPDIEQKYGMSLSDTSYIAIGMIFAHALELVTDFFKTTNHSETHDEQVKAMKDSTPLKKGIKAD